MGAVIRDDLRAEPQQHLYIQAYFRGTITAHLLYSGFPQQTGTIEHMSSPYSL